MFFPLESNICFDVLPVETRAVSRNTVHMKTIPNNTQMQMMFVLSRLKSKEMTLQRMWSVYIGNLPTFIAETSHRAMSSISRDSEETVISETM